MKITKCGKAVAYAVLSVCLTALAIWIVSPLHNAAEYMAGYWRSDILLFLTACTLLGIGVYSFFAYTRRTAHRVDSWYFMAVGAVLLVFSVVVIVRFGGITAENFDVTATAALNLNVGAAGVLPIPFLVRGWVLAGTARFSRRQRATACIAVGVGTAMYLMALIGKQLLFRI